MINVSHYINYKNIIVLHYDSILLITVRKWAWRARKIDKDLLKEIISAVIGVDMGREGLKLKILMAISE